MAASTLIMLQGYASLYLSAHPAIWSLTIDLKLVSAQPTTILFRLRYAYARIRRFNPYLFSLLPLPKLRNGFR
ncbi:uncharacterized protein F4807DRAFT_443306 [Annulohypoxylon truncatum]|uniref:uncharacterized protein n=1 Tax=Annulohypoxylon truncatum TaxID=327061 RepID=UPI0020084823|nr:uncharacterized protein F4807DRAFT_443306 [Annulohypoxylon truncatum]KAI1205442.1 hypothetical protein F4807DRAFT_443306 [Annulohypoxylon truncatum]